MEKIANTFSPKYGIAVKCLSSSGNCQEACEICMRHPDQYFETQTIMELRKCKDYLEFLGFKVDKQPNMRYTFLNDK